jgi:predicted AlkP superfamily pyrophosphatase or phosphodiesterase
MLGLLPESVAGRWRLRHWLSKFIAKSKGYTGYFEIYAMSFKKIAYFDYSEKCDIFIPGGLAPVANLADRLSTENIPYHISNWRLTEEDNVASLVRDIEKEDIRFAFLYTAAMDSLLHRVTKTSNLVQDKLDCYASKIKRIADTATRHYRKISISVFSDHGMTTKTAVVDVMAIIGKLGFKFGRDYASVYDSTMARFWFMNDNARAEINDTLLAVPRSRIVSDADKARYGIDFADNMYGETILLMDPGVQIEPCDMGLKALPGMHGFSPEHEDSNAAFLSTSAPSSAPKWVGDYFNLMTDSFSVKTGANR